MMNAWLIFVLLAIAGIFVYHVWSGWRAGEVRLPLAILVFQEFERERSPANFWGIMLINAIVAFAVLVVAMSLVWGALVYSEKPIGSLRSLNGCYEGVGAPDFMRPPRHWSFRINDGAVVSREGNEVSKIRLLRSTASRTHVGFAPGILVGGKPQTVFAGDTIAGEAYLGGGRVAIVMADDWQNFMQSTTCD